MKNILLSIKTSRKYTFLTSLSLQPPHLCSQGFRPLGQRSVIHSLAFLYKI